jgi:AraC-like DNA-binding protein
MPRRLSVDAICRLIEALLPGGYPVIGEVAELLQTSSRTFQRQLNEEGLSYSDLVERCRCRAACESLQHTLDPVQDIAAMLGYRDVSSFSRAFQRWTGKTPRAYRSQSISQPDNQPDSLVSVSEQ